jgi:acyl carrier protein
MYGITETTVFLTLKRLRSDAVVSGSVGRRLADQALYLLDEQHQPVPLGSVGEIYVGGAGLARGYLNREELTQSRFLENPYATEAMRAGGQHRMYKTGDIARFTPEGELVYIGRNDDQVKIRGFRIELGEIEHQLAACPGVSASVVLVREASGQKHLVAYVVLDPRSGKPGDDWMDAIRHRLREKLAEYMIPSAFVALEAMPLNANGKVDKKVLPSPSLLDSQPDYQAPSTDMERLLVEIWSELLAHPSGQLSVAANFFEVGGDSLLAVRLATEIQQRISIKPDLRQLFACSSLRAMAQLLDRLQKTRDLAAALQDADQGDIERVEIL